LAAVAIVAVALAAIWVSGHFEAFARDRGLLQLLVAIPLASLGTAAGLAWFRLLTTRQMLWAMLPVEMLILLGAGILGLDYRAWPWALALSGFLFIPWVAGFLIGSALADRRSRQATAG
jgi:hypothetical protein